MSEIQIDSAMRRGVERRLEFIEYRLFWEGGVNRADITGKFGVSQPQASNDLTQYQRLAPANIRYDTSEKRYLPTEQFKPIFHEPNASHYLVELKSVADHILSPEESWSGAIPEVGVMPVPGRRIKPAILRSLVQAIRSRKAIHAHYHSMSDQRPDAIWRWITPHAFGYDGLRWHTRAFCHIDGKFKDFVLSRFIDVGESGPAAIEASADRDWFSVFNVVLQPNPRLGQSKMRTVELDYEMSDGQLTLPVRHALLYYLDKRLRLDVGEKLDKPHETPVVVANRDEFEKAIKGANGAALQTVVGHK